MAMAAQPLAKRWIGVVTQGTFKGVTVPCPLCQSDSHTIVSEKDRHGGPLRTVLCQRCGHVFTNPQPTEQDLKDFYKTQYRTDYKGTVIPKTKHVYRAGLRALERFEQLNAFCKPGARILDVGAGGGEFVYLLHRAGYDAHGLEPNQGYANFARDRYGINVQTGNAEDIISTEKTWLSTEQTWDVITVHHVLEHLADPATALQCMSEVLRPDGKLIVEVPNVEARYHSPGHRFHFAHLHSFSRDGLVLAGQRSGLNALTVTLQPHTGHVNIVFQKGPAKEGHEPQAAAAGRIEAALRSDTPARDLMTARPYRRLWTNLNRPIRERFAVRKLGSPANAKDLLDRLYASELERQKAGPKA